MAEAVALPFDTYKNQMKDIAEKSVHIGVGGFCSVDQEDFMGSVKNRSGAIMVLEPVSYRTSDSKTDHIVEYMTCGFSIYKKAAPGKIADNDQAIEECRAIARRVMSRIRKNTYGRVPADELAKFRHFLAGSITGEPIKMPVLDGRIGYFQKFEIYYQISLAYHDEDWTD